MVLPDILETNSSDTEAQKLSLEAKSGFDLTPKEMEKFKIWPGGVIPYIIDELSFVDFMRDRIRTFLNSVNATTGLQFVELKEPPESNQTRFVLFINRLGQMQCDDLNTNKFTNQGVQRVSIGFACFYDQELSSIVLALAGVPPQHNAPNRDNYISIENENIWPERRHLFEKLQNTDWLFHDIKYDFKSAGHYRLYKYSMNGLNTIKPLVPLNTNDVGKGKGFSYSDILKIRMLYNYIKIKMASNPGPDFDIYNSRKYDDVQPRKKPDKYLGLTGAGENKNEIENEYQENGKVDNLGNKQYDNEMDKMDDSMVLEGMILEEIEKLRREK